MNLIFATNNQHKVDEIRAVLPPDFHLKTLKEAGIDIDIPEPHDTLQDNAREKAATIFQRTGTSCFSEDTGLEVFSLNGEPGVKSARYAGDDKDFQQNIDKLLLNLQGKEDRSARFRTVVCLILDGEEHFFEGICTGRIIEEQRGSGGFGYDPVFIPDGATKTFAEMSTDEKNRFSHRRKAVDQLVAFFSQQANKQ
ncbi:RdgB/HAM1 family non-canonical purine NTP pyrophosphatase [Flavisolibacter nicotianae]|uniref:RdgB/HAM1 family non-canonical purine NTP pyrophosphatase n=1 Tax=Flavisolibacter nicotianae TaxID=2364882 RepID=UPI000EAFAA1F|nr:RdgB/HAM1 family non-canonical purine NTP pyrophosphatase [Flavisolibacter nicotianae]